MSKSKLLTEYLEYKNNIRNFFRRAEAHSLLLLGLGILGVIHILLSCLLCFLWQWLILSQTQLIREVLSNST